VLCSLIIIIYVSVYFGLYNLSSLEFDAVDRVSYIVDGDTFDVASGYRIRLADVDCPESYEYGYDQASDFLRGLIYGKQVFMDTDDVYYYDYDGTGDRVVCVIYVESNSTHFINVNKALVEYGHAVYRDFYNEFSPYTWTLFVSRIDRAQLQAIRVVSGAAAIIGSVVIYKVASRIWRELSARFKGKEGTSKEGLGLYPSGVRSGHLKRAGENE